MSNWHGGKGPKRRNSNETAYADNWDTIFGKKDMEEVKARKVLPPHAKTQVQKDKTKVIPRKSKNDSLDNVS